MQSPLTLGQQVEQNTFHIEGMIVCSSWSYEQCYRVSSALQKLFESDPIAPNFTKIARIINPKNFKKRYENNESQGREDKQKTIKNRMIKMAWNKISEESKR